MRVAMIQMDMELGRPDENFEKAVRLTEEACAARPDVITLPETWNVGFFPRKNLEELSDRDCSRVRRIFLCWPGSTQSILSPGLWPTENQTEDLYDSTVFDRKES